MITVKKAAAQGDILFIRVDNIPNGYTESIVTGPVVLAHSYSGHNHEIAQGQAKLYLKSGEGMLSYLQVLEHCEVVHLRPFDTHETLQLTAGIWEVRRQRESTPEGWKRVED